MTDHDADQGSAIAELLEQVRAGLSRVGPAEAARIAARGGLLVDIRPLELRRRHGTVPGAVVVDRNQLEWRLDPTSPDRLPEVVDAGQEIVLVCQEGFASSLAAGSLQALGLRRATDLDGGFVAWAAAGLPVEPPAKTLEP